MSKSEIVSVSGDFLRLRRLLHLLQLGYSLHYVRKRPARVMESNYNTNTHVAKEGAQFFKLKTESATYG